MCGSIFWGNTRRKVACMIDLNFCFPVLLRESESQSESEGIAATRVTAVVTVTKMHLKVHSASILNYDFQFDICVKEREEQKICFRKWLKKTTDTYLFSKSK